VAVAARLASAEGGGPAVDGRRAMAAVPRAWPRGDGGGPRGPAVSGRRATAKVPRARRWLRLEEGRRRGATHRRASGEERRGEARACWSGERGGRRSCGLATARWRSGGAKRTWGGGAGRRARGEGEAGGSGTGGAGEMEGEAAREGWRRNRIFFFYWGAIEN